MDGRQIRKAVLQACATSKEVAIDPNLLTMDELIRTLKSMKKEQK